MSIAIDIRHACRRDRTGKGQWVYGFVQELLRGHLETVLLTDALPPPEWHGAETVSLPAGARWHLSAIHYLRTHPKITHWFSPTSFILPAMMGMPASRSLLIHDLIAFRSEPHERKAKIMERILLPRALSRTAHVFTVSEATRSDLLQKFPSALEVTVLGAGPLHTRARPNTPDGRTILCIGTLCPRKNQLRLIEAYGRLPHPLRERHRLLLVGGRGWHDAEIVRAARETEGVEWIGYVGADAYRDLIGTCAVFAFPSLYEGFGMQVLDALSVGALVLTSARGSLAEVAGDAAFVVDPEDIASIASGLHRLLTDQKLISRLRETGPRQAAKFTWQNAVARFLGTIQWGRC